MKILALGYHDVVPPGRYAESGFAQPTADRYKLTIGDFDDHLEAIAQAVHKGPVSTNDLVAAKDIHKPLLLTFDDGGVSAYALIADRLEKYGWRGHFLIPTDFIGTPGFVTHRHIQELRARGHVIGSHSSSHPERMSCLSRQEVIAEWKKSVDILADILGEAITVASVPGGYYDRAVAQAASGVGLRVLFTSEPRTHCHHVDQCLVVGRYSIRRGTSAAVAAGLATGHRSLRWQQWCSWNLKKLAKAVGGARYLQLRRLYANEHQR